MIGALYSLVVDSGDREFHGFFSIKKQEIKGE